MGGEAKDICCMQWAAFTPFLPQAKIVRSYGLKLQVLLGGFHFM